MKYLELRRRFAQYRRRTVTNSRSVCSFSPEEQQWVAGGNPAASAASVLGLDSGGWKITGPKSRDYFHLRDGFGLDCRLTREATITRNSLLVFKILNDSSTVIGSGLVSMSESNPTQPSSQSSRQSALNLRQATAGEPVSRYLGTWLNYCFIFGSRFSILLAYYIIIIILYTYIYI